MREHERELFERCARVLLPKDWLRLQLTGECVSEMSDASGTLWLDVGARRWSDEVLAACGMTVAQMPRLVEGSEVSGQLRAPLARRWGLRAGIPVAGGGGDNAASAVGVGAAQPNEGFVSLALGGVATKPWRARIAEQMLLGAEATEQTFARAAAAELAPAIPLPGNAFKIDLACRTVVAVLRRLAAERRGA